VEEAHPTIARAAFRRASGDPRAGNEEIVSNMHHHEDPYVALRDAFGAVRRRLEESVRETRAT